eukprot:5394_1
MSITISNSKDTTESRIVSGKIELSCPQTAEQKDTEIIDSVTKTQRIEEKASEEDFDYNPNEETQPESEDVSSDSASESEEIESEEYDEERIINSLEFQEAFESAIENVKYIAKCDREILLEKIKEENITDEIGEESLDEQIAKAFETFIIEESEYSLSEESEYDSIDERIDEEEYRDAIENIYELGKYHQEIFANEICDTFSNLNGREATIEELTNIFGNIRKNFADEAREEFMELNDIESDSDSDYDPDNESDEEQVEKDNFIDLNQKVEIVFIDNDSDSEYFSSESESESETESESVSVSDSELSDDDSEYDSEYDDDYEPGKDSYDYSQDIEDGKIFNNELNGTDENEVTCVEYSDDD